MVGADRVRTIHVKAESREVMDSVIAQITALLVERHDVEASQPDFSVQTQQDIIATQEATTEAFRDLLASVAGVSLRVGRRHRHYEHHVGKCDGANAGDWRHRHLGLGLWMYSFSSCSRGRHSELAGSPAGGREGSPGCICSVHGHYAHGAGSCIDPFGFWCGGDCGCVFWLLPGNLWRQ